MSQNNDNEVVSQPVVKLKHLLPSTFELKHLSRKLDLVELKKAFANIKDKAVSVYEANQGLCEFHPMLATSVYGHFTQIPLSKRLANNVDFAATEDKLSAVSTFRKNRELLKNPMFDEHNFTKDLDYVDNTYLAFIKTLFLSKPTRSRITILEAGKVIPYHIDYDPSYAVRVIIPIHTNDKVLNLSKVKGEEVTANLEEGKAYFLNTGIPHSVVNTSLSARVALMYSIQGTDDLKAAGLI